MDKRKLKVGKFTRMGDTCLELETRGLCAIMGAGNQKTREEDAAELAKRWNAYPEAESRILELTNAVHELLRYAHGLRGEWADPLGTAEYVMNEGRAFLDTLKTN